MIKVSGERGQGQSVKAGQAQRTVFPDFTVTNEDLIVSADGSKVAVRSVSGGSHSGEMLDIPATGKRAEFRAFDIPSSQDGVMVRTWHLEDSSRWSCNLVIRSFAAAASRRETWEKTGTRNP
jgi:predicted ester cyclase